MAKKKSLLTKVKTKVSTRTMLLIATGLVIIGGAAFGLAPLLQTNTIFNISDSGLKIGTTPLNMVVYSGQDGSADSAVPTICNALKNKGVIKYDVDYTNSKVGTLTSKACSGKNWLGTISSIAYQAFNIKTTSFFAGSCKGNTTISYYTSVNCAEKTPIYKLDIYKEANGTMVSTDGKINCGSGGNVCSATYNQGASVTLHGNPNASYVFNGWDPNYGYGFACTNANTLPYSDCTFTMTMNRSIRGGFIANPNYQPYTPPYTSPYTPPYTKPYTPPSITPSIGVETPLNSNQNTVCKTATLKFDIPGKIYTDNIGGPCKILSSLESSVHLLNKYPNAINENWSYATISNTSSKWTEVPYPCLKHGEHWGISYQYPAVCYKYITTRAIATCSNRYTTSCSVAPSCSYETGKISETTTGCSSGKKRYTCEESDSKLSLEYENPPNDHSSPMPEIPNICETMFSDETNAVDLSKIAKNIVLSGNSFYNGYRYQLDSDVCTDKTLGYCKASSFQCSRIYETPIGVEKCGGTASSIQMGTSVTPSESTIGRTTARVVGNQKNTCQKVMISGKIEDKANVVISGLGFANDQEFNDALTKALSINGSGFGLFSTEPLKSNRDKFNIWTTGNNPTDISNDVNMLDILSKDIWSACGFATYKVMLVKKPYFRPHSSFPSTGSETYVTLSNQNGSLNTLWDKIMTHEFGHGFSGLGDEYSYLSEMGNITLKPEASQILQSLLPPFENCVPNKPANWPTATQNCSFQRSYWKPSSNSIMNDEDAISDYNWINGFGDINKAVIQKALDKYK